MGLRKGQALSTQVVRKVFILKNGTHQACKVGAVAWVVQHHGFLPVMQFSRNAAMHGPADHDRQGVGHGFQHHHGIVILQRRMHQTVRCTVGRHQIILRAEKMHPLVQTEFTDLRHIPRHSPRLTGHGKLHVQRQLLERRQQRIEACSLVLIGHEEQQRFVQRQAQHATAHGARDLVLLQRGAGRDDRQTLAAAWIGLLALQP